MGAVQKLVLGALCLGSLNACGPDLGECDPSMLGGSATVGMVRPNDGQAIVAQRCASGLCHSAGAEGVNRRGAPAGLDFDVVVGSTAPADLARLRRGTANVVDWAQDMWSEIESGTMPPAAPAGTGELSAGDKEKVRNWLACGAPAIEPDPTAPTATWDSIWTAMSGDCVGCHSTAAGPTFGFVLGDDACSSYANLVGKPASGPMCTGMGTLVVPNSPADSILYTKINPASGTCGSPMPQGSATGLAVSKPNIVALVEQWIMNGALPPAGCP